VQRYTSHVSVVCGFVCSREWGDLACSASAPAEQLLLSLTMAVVWLRYWAKGTGEWQTEATVGGHIQVQSKWGDHLQTINDSMCRRPSNVANLANDPALLSSSQLVPYDF
jgi:hypothetical protein